MINTIKNFFKKLFSDSSEVSSKRVIAFGAFLLISAMVIVSLSGGVIIPEFIFFGVVALLLTVLGYNTFLTSKGLDTKASVSTSIVEQKSTNDIIDKVADIVQNDKPS